LGQLPTDWSPDVNSYSGTAVGYGRIQGDFTNATASDYSGSWRTLGLNDVRVFSDPNTYVEGYTTNRVWCLLHVLAHLRWGYGQDYPRSDIQSFIDAAAWCDEFVTLTDANGNTFSGVRSTFNAEVTARAIQQQVKDICTAGRLGIPFEFEGKDVIVPLKAEEVDDPAIPVFTDEGPNRNIVYDGAKSSLSWSVISDETLTNQWTVNFDDATNGGVDTQLIFGDQPQQLRAGRAWGDHSKRVLNKSQSAFGITSQQEAARFGNSLLYLGPLDSGGILNPFSVKFTTWYSKAFNVQNYKIIKVVNAKLQSRMSQYFTSRGLEPYPDADYTVFRVMKYTRKGDLRIDIEAQQYATLDEAPGEECIERAAEWDPSFDVVTGADGEVHCDDALPITSGPFDSWAIAGGQPLTQEGDYFEFTVHEAGQQINVGLRTVNTDPTGGEFPFGSDFPFIFYFGTSSSVPNLITGGFGFFSSNGRSPYSTSDVFRLTRTATGVEYRINGELFHTDTPDGEFTTPATMTPNLYPAFYGGYSFGSSTVPVGLATAVVFTCEEGGISSTFSAPRDLTALVTASTGLVHFHWSPPVNHPELVTGYTLYEADGVIVAMPTTLVYNFELTLAPGVYTYKLNDTDGATVSSFVSVTFTVPVPPVDLGLIDRETGNTMSDRATGQLLESRA
jgi:hypothetical protein